MKSRSILAKLLATENITVQSSSTQPTASFDIQNRVLTLPVLEHHDDDVYEMFVGHEVAHALYTPLEGAEKAHQNVEDHDRGFYQACLNVIEDIRIEKAIQKKYKGLSKSFAKAYDVLWEQGMFGVVDATDVPSLNFIDRLNIHYKQRWSYSGVEVPFSDEEQAIVDLADTAVTFDDTIEVATTLFDYIKEQSQATPESQESAESSESKEFKESNNEEAFEEFKKKYVKPEFQDDPESQQLIREAFDKFNEQMGDTLTETEQPSTGDAKSETTSVTQNALNNAFKDATNHEWDDKASRENRVMIKYGDLDIDIDSIIIPFDRIYKEFNDYLPHYEADAIEWQKSLKPEVNHLSKEFNLKKSAEAHRRATINRTGMLDHKALHKYKYSDEIFLSQTIVPKGKNHGMVAFIDWSGSMSNVIGQTIDQLAIMANFCFNNAIPFQAYAYHSRNNGHVAKNGEPISESFSLIELFTPLPRRSTFDAQMKMLHLAKQSAMCEYGAPTFFGLAGTPLNVTLAVAPKIVNAFAKATGVEKLTTVVLTDGCDNYGLRTKIAGDFGYQNYCLTNPINGRPVDTDDTNQMYGYLKATTGSKVVVIQLSHTPELSNFRSVWNHDKASYELLWSWSQEPLIQKAFKQKGYVTYKRPDFDMAIVANIKALTKTVATIDDLDDDASTTKVRNTFRKARANKKKSKAVLTAFASQFA